MTTLYQII